MLGGENFSKTKVLQVETLKQDRSKYKSDYLGLLRLFQDNLRLSLDYLK